METKAFDTRHPGMLVYIKYNYNLSKTKEFYFTHFSKHIFRHVLDHLQVLDQYTEEYTY